MKNVIMIVHKLFPYIAGDALYNVGLANEFARHCNLTVYALIQDDYDIADVPCNSFATHYYYCHNRDFKRINAEMVDAVIRQIDNEHTDIVLVSSILMNRYFFALKKHRPDITYGYISHNAEFVNMAESLNYRSGPHKKQSVKEICMQKQCEIIEKKLLTKADFCLSISRNDIELHREKYKKICKCYHCKPLIDFPRVKTVEDVKHFSKKIVVIGTMKWYPNVIGVTWFIQNVMDKLSREGWTLYVVGRDPDSRIIDAAKGYQDSVVVTGKVDSVQEYLRDCDISVVPIFNGTGTKIKVLESIAAGIPTVATSFAAKDYDIDGEILIADTADEFMEAVHRIERDGQLRQQLVVRSEKYYENYKKLSPEILEILKEVRR